MENSAMYSFPYYCAVAMHKFSTILILIFYTCIRKISTLNAKWLFIRCQME